MGRGLAAILSVVPRDEEEEFRELPLELIARNPAQPRRAFDEQGLLALAECCSPCSSDPLWAAAMS
jgi:hypothetical protein